MQEQLLATQMEGTPEEKAARARLHELAMGDLPDVPLRGVAPIGPETKETAVAKKTAMEMIQPQDIFQLPEVQGIIQEAIVRGNLLTNRLGRKLQATGTITSTPGRDVLGRAVGDVQKDLAASLAPFAMEERSRRRGMIPLLAGMGLTQEERERGVLQERLNALFAQQAETAFLPSTYQKPFLESILGLQPAVQPFIPSGGTPSMAYYAQPIGQAISALLTPKPKEKTQTTPSQYGSGDIYGKETYSGSGIYEGRA